VTILAFERSRPDDLLPRYLQHLRRRQLAKATLRVYGATLRSYTKALDALTVTTEDIEQWLDTRNLNIRCRQGPGRSRRCYIAAIAGFHRWLVEDDARADDPTIKLVRPKVRQRQPRPIADDDLKTALAQASPRMRLWLCLAAFAGLRCFEIAGLAMGDIEMDPPTLRLRETKGGKPRSIPIAPVVLVALEAVELPTSGPAFPGPSGRPLTAKYVSAEINTYLRSRGIKATAHQLRHSFATEIYAGTRDLMLVRELLGHSDISTTSLYIALVPSPAAVEAVRGLGRA
jgi:integrase/recombinase XerC